MERVEVDFNVRARNGSVRVRREYVPDGVGVGAAVLVFDSEEPSVVTTATVRSIEDSLVYLDVDWDGFRTVGVDIVSSSVMLIVGGNHVASGGVVWAAVSPVSDTRTLSVVPPRTAVPNDRESINA